VKTIFIPLLQKNEQTTMKKLILSVTLLVITSIISCTNLKDEILDNSANLLKTEEVKIWFEISSIKPKNKRVKGDRFSNLEPLWKLAKEERTKKGSICLEVPLKYSDDVRWMTNLGTDGREDLLINRPKLTMVVYVNKGERVTTIKEVRPSTEYNRMYRGRIIKDKFSGKVLVWNWSGDLLGGSFYKDGKRLGSISPVEVDKSARTTERICTVYTDCTWSSVCYDHPAMQYPILYGTTTHSTGSSASCSSPYYGHGDGMFGCTPWELTGSYSHTECYDVEDPGDGEGGGPVEVDTFQGFPTNPYHGQVVEYEHPNGRKTFFIYDVNFGLWMLPEVNNMRTRDFDIQITAPNLVFAGGILGVYAIPLAVEPTQIGKIVLGGAALVYAGLYVYDQTTFINYLRSNEHLEHCIRLYSFKCASGPCDDCLHFCRQQGYWPSHLCRLN
jgi:hypothetical protein